MLRKIVNSIVRVMKKKPSFGGFFFACSRKIDKDLGLAVAISCGLHLMLLVPEMEELGCESKVSNQLFLASIKVERIAKKEGDGIESGKNVRKASVAAGEKVYSNEVANSRNVRDTQENVEQMDSDLRLDKMALTKIRLELVRKFRAVGGEELSRLLESGCELSFELSSTKQTLHNLKWTKPCSVNTDFQNTEKIVKQAAGSLFSEIAFQKDFNIDIQLSSD